MPVPVAMEVPRVRRLDIWYFFTPKCGLQRTPKASICVGVAPMPVPVAMEVPRVFALIPYGLARAQACAAKARGTSIATDTGIGATFR